MDLGFNSVSEISNFYILNKLLAQIRVYVNYSLCHLV